MRRCVRRRGRLFRTESGLCEAVGLWKAETEGPATIAAPGGVVVAATVIRVLTGVCRGRP